MKPREITSLTEFLKIVKQDILQPRLTADLSLKDKDYKKKSEERYNQFNQWVSDSVDSGERDQIYIETRQSEFPRTKGIETLKMDFRFPLNGYVSKSELEKMLRHSYQRTDRGRLLGKFSDHAEIQLSTKSSDEKIYEWVKGQFAFIHSKFMIEQICGRIDSGTALFPVVYRSSSTGDVYDITEPFQAILQQYRKEYEAGVVDAQPAPPEKKQKPKMAGIPRSNAMTQDELVELKKSGLEKQIAELSTKVKSLEDVMKAKSGVKLFQIDDDLQNRILELSRLKKELLQKKNELERLDSPAGPSKKST